MVRGTGLGDLATQATGTPGLSVEVQPGYAFIDGYAYKLASAVETVDVAIPATLDPIDLVQAKLEDWSVSIKTGAESASPVTLMWMWIVSSWRRSISGRVCR